MESKIAVIDFETANNARNSACQIGVVLLDGWEIVDEREWLIRPQRMYFSPQCIQVHGLTARDCMDSPKWDEVWNELHPLLDGRILIAHNVGFDAAVLQGTCQSYDMAVPSFDLQCTRLIAKRAWPGQKGYGLAAIAERLDIRFRHHHALEDSRACAQIAIAAALKSNSKNLEELEDNLGLTRGRIWVDQIRQPRTVRRTRLETVDEPQARYQPKLFRLDGTPTSKTELIRQTRLRADAILAGCEDSRPLSGKYVVLINSLLGMQRDDSVSFLEKLGAKVQDRLNLQTHYMIMGAISELDAKSGIQEGAGAEALAETEAQGETWKKEVDLRNRDGQSIRILTQRQLLACIPSALAIARGDG